MKKFQKTTTFFKLSLFLLFMFFSFSANAQLLQSKNASKIRAQSDSLRVAAGFADPSTGNSGNIGGIAQLVIEGFLGLLAIIFIILVIIAGFSWMTAGGDESKVTYAKDTLKRAIIGLIIIAASFAITAFIFRNISMDDTNNGGYQSSDGTVDGI